MTLMYQHMCYLQVILGESLLSTLGFAVPGCTSEININKNNIFIAENTS